MNINLVVFLLIWINLTKKIYCYVETAEERKEQIISELNFTDWNLSDYYEDTIKIKKKVLLHTEKFSNEVDIIMKYGKFLKEESIRFSKFPVDDIPYRYQRTHEFFIKPGDYLLNQTDFHKLVTFAEENSDLSRNARITYPHDSNQTLGKQTFLDLLATSRNLSLLQEIWVNWQDSISKYSQQFGDILPLVEKAASDNGAYNARSYWESQSEYEDGYQKAETLWSEIEPLYRKLHAFVLIRINNYYKTNFTEIPVYLTGSNYGEDWSNLAELLIPHQQMYKDAEFAFERQSMINVYKLAEDSAYKMNFPKFHRKFWAKRNFDYEICSPTVFIYTTSKYSEILTCNNLTWSSYMNAHEAVLEAGVKSVDYQSMPRRNTRQSFLNEAIISLGSIIAVQNLPEYGFTPKSDYVSHINASAHTLSAKLHIALRLLPRLAYYMAADNWRLEELEYPSDNKTSNWWEIRKKYQGIQGMDDEEADFLGDSYIVSNKPYLAKFLGSIFIFEILSYHQLQPFMDNNNLGETLGREVDFKNTIQELPFKSPMDDLSYNYYVSEINSGALTEFFAPLEYYLETAPLVPYPVIHRERTTDPPPEPTTVIPVTTTIKATTTVAVKEEVPPVQNDQQITNHPDSKSIPSPTETSTSSATGHSAGMYIVITIGACFFIFIAVIVFKKLVKMKRPRTNNRRFET